MIKVIIFGGTTEGRELAQFCARYQIPAMICVTSEYGSRLLPDAPCIRVHTGKLDEVEMIGLISVHRPELVIDATHPYARVVTELVRKTCEKIAIPCRRILRGGAVKSAGTEQSGCRLVTVPDVAAAVAFLENTSGAIFLTTGSKNLAEFMTLPDSEKRIYARVLPDSRILAACEQLGVTGSHLIGMQGPFDRELNQAMLKQTKAAWMVTKESGDPGGFIDKIAAAQSCGVSVVVIGRPVAETGISVAEARKLLQPYGVVPPRHLHLIGMGMGGGRQLTVEAVEAMQECQVFLGAGRMLADLAPWIGEKDTHAIYHGEKIIAWLKEHPEYDTIGVIYSGDTGFYSGSHSLIEAVESAQNAKSAKFDKSVQSDNSDYSTGDKIGAICLHIYPGISTVACLCARLKTSWEDVALASIHGRETDVIGLMSQHRRVFLLLGGKAPLPSLCRMLIDHGYDNVRIAAGERLGYPDERIMEGTPAQLAGTDTGSLIAVLIVQEGKETDNNEG